MRILVDRIIEGNIHYIKAAGKSTEVPPTKNICSGSMYVQVDNGTVQLFDEIDGEWHNFAKFDTGASASASVGSTFNGGFGLGAGLGSTHEEATEEPVEEQPEEDAAEPVEEAAEDEPGEDER